MVQTIGFRAWPAREQGSRQAGACAPAADARRADKGRAARADLTPLKRRFERDVHDRNSRRVLGGMMGLLLMSESLAGKPGPERRPFPPFCPGDLSPAVVVRASGAKPLAPAEAPGLYALLLTICARAGMGRVPELFLLPAPEMNAFALGAPDNACITVTRGLLDGLSRAEVAGILAHEVAHIVNRDSGAMNWAAAIRDKISRLAMRGVAEMANQSPGRADGRRWMLLASAPAMARLLFLALSRVREFDADALALDFIDDPGALAGALCKLERFHSGLSPLGAYLRRDPLSRSLHSHPDTFERIARLM